jgi:adenosylcobinamide kinase/adenosylcobinamide-phosphate guanylyltransferase
MADAELLVITGGVRSGKSAHATAIAEESAGPLLYIATADTESDPELAERVLRLRSSRSRRFATIEVPIEVTGGLVSLRGISAAVLDCYGTWIRNMVGKGMSEGEITGRVETFVEVARAREHRTIIITSEAGWGAEPTDKIQRQARDLHCALNQRLVHAADGVILMISGLPMRVKARQALKLFAG